MKITSQSAHNFQLSAFRDHCRIPWTDDNSALQRSLDAGVSMWEKATNWYLRATTVEIAREAADLIQVEWEVLKPVLSIEQALAPDAPILHEGQETLGTVEMPEIDSNITNHVLFEGGDLQAGFAQADVIVEGWFETPMVHQGYIEPHACLANAREVRESQLFEVRL